MNPTSNFAENQLDLNNILDQSREHLSHISSIRYSSSVTTEDKQANTPKVDRINQTFIYDNSGKYRMSMATADSEHNFQRVIAFNGDIYQELNPDMSTLNISRTKLLAPYMGMEIITTSYLFAIPPGPGSEFSIDALREDKIWQNLKNTARYRSKQKIMGHQCVVIEIPHPAPPGAEAEAKEVVHVVAFAEDLDYFPVQYDSEVNGIVVSKWELNKYVINIVGESKFIIPLSLKGVAFNLDGEIRKVTTFAVEPKSVEINKPIPEEIFTIPTNQVDLWIDYDLGASSHLSMKPVDDLLSSLANQPEESANEMRTKKYGTSQQTESNSLKRPANKYREISHHTYSETNVMPRRRLLYVVMIVAILGAAISSVFVVHAYTKKRQKKNIL